MRDSDLGPQFFREMVDAVGVGVAIYGSDGRYAYVNDAYADLFDVPCADLVGAALWEVVSDFEAERFDGYWASFEDGETRSAETEHSFAGTTVPVATITTRRRIDGTPYHFGTIRDISERKRREAEIVRQNERLSSFAGVVSHDLRNPLNVAKGYLDILQADLDRDELDLVESSLSRMELLISDLLTLARGGDTIGDTEHVSLADQARAAWETTDTAGATLRIPDENGTIVADSDRLQQLFENLIRNAVEHGGDDVAVTIGMLADDGGFFVADDGPGIDSDVRGELFDAGVSTNAGGTGFGLSIVKEIAEAHGWEIAVTESVDGGARFEFRAEY